VQLNLPEYRRACGLHLRKLLDIRTMQPHCVRLPNNVRSDERTEHGVAYGEAVHRPFDNANGRTVDFAHAHALDLALDRTIERADGHVSAISRTDTGTVRSDGSAEHSTKRSSELDADNCGSDSCAVRAANERSDDGDPVGSADG
jgi:hypothetical protein|tara:strand:- start:1031 stop:1465 length:435 start_codon:yes stop_codon:yes gene_type:complete